MDRKNGNTLWIYYVDKEIRNNAVDFDIHENIGPCILATAPRGYRIMTSHMIFDVKLDLYFTRKERLGADGYNVEKPTFMTHVYVVSRDSVIIVPLHAALNGLGVQCANLHNACLSTNSKERVYFYSGAEIGKYWGKYLTWLESCMN